MKRTLNRYRLLPLTAVILASACATSPKIAERADGIESKHAGRNLASSEGDAEAWDLSDEQLETYFQKLMSYPDPSKEVVRALDEQVGIFYRAQKELKQFDAELDAALADPGGKKPTLADFKSYPRLMVYWAISHRSRHRIVHVYQRLLETRLSEADRKSENFRKAHSALNALAKYARHAQGSDRLALSWLGPDLKPIYQGLADEYHFRGKVPAFRSQMSQLAFDRAGELTALARKAETQQELDRKVQALIGVKDEISSEVNQLAPALQEQMKELAAPGREIQSEGDAVYPSAGPHGTVSGREYKTGDWSLTFDDGPLPKYSSKILANLQKHGFKADFFELAQNAQRYPDMVRELQSAGMTMANHSWSHAQLPKLNDAKLRHEIIDAEDQLARIEGERPKFFRCPYGSGLNVKRVREMIASQGMIHVFWNVDTLDWQDKNPDSIVARARKQMELNKRGIILFHDIHPQSAEASGMLMEWMSQAPGIHVRSVAEVVDELNQKTSP